MAGMAVQWLSPLLWCAAVAVGVYGQIVYWTRVCPGVREHKNLTKLLCPHFILEEFRKRNGGDGSAGAICRTCWICFAGPLVLIVLAMLCDQARHE